MMAVTTWLYSSGRSQTISSRLEAGAAQVATDGFDQCVDASGIDAGVERAAPGSGVQRDRSRLEELRRHEDQHGVHAIQAAPRHALVRDSVLGQDHRRRRRRLDQVVERAQRVLRLHGEEDDLVTAPIELARMADRGEQERPRPFRRLDVQTSGADPLEVLAARDQRDVMPRRREQRSDAAADAARSVDDGSQYGRSPLTVTRLPERVCGQ